ncbi:MAG: amidohydrolase family protein [Bacillota bacterium]
MYIDVHVHPVPEEIVKEFPRGLFEEYVDMFGVDMYEAVAVEQMVEEFEAANISKAVLLPVAPCTVNPAVSYSHVTANQVVADIVKQYPDRFIGFASVNPHQGQTAVDELERCVRELNLKGLKLLYGKPSRPADENKALPPPAGG